MLHSGYRPDRLKFKSQQGQEFVSSPKRPDWFWSPPNGFCGWGGSL